MFPADNRCFPRIYLIAIEKASAFNQTCRIPHKNLAFLMQHTNVIPSLASLRFVHWVDSFRDEIAVGDVSGFIRKEARLTVTWLVAAGPLKTLVAAVR